MVSCMTKELLLQGFECTVDETMLESLKLADPQAVEYFQDGLSLASEEEDTAQLPVELWRLIAKHMSSRCWARVSRTCKAMHSVQPEQIDVCVRSQSALAWVQTHWDQASSLKLTWMKSDIPCGMPHNAASLKLLRRLELCRRTRIGPATATLLKWLLARVPHLQLLSVRHPIAFLVPPIRNLRHLIMASTQFTSKSATCIRRLHNLQTLWLGRIDEPHAGNNSAEFDLSSLPFLADVCVVNIPMPSLSLPEQCRLHLVGDEENKVWCTTGKQGHLKSIDLHSAGYTAPESGLDDIIDFLCSRHYSVLKWWGMTQLGGVSEGAVYFQAWCFPCLTHLYLQAEEILIYLELKLPLQVLHLEAKSLGVVCENAQEQAKKLQQLRVQYRATRGADIFVLVGAMCGMGAKVNKLDLKEPE